jgi:hypothetical protein
VLAGDDARPSRTGDAGLHRGVKAAAAREAGGWAVLGDEEKERLHLPR